MNPDYPNFHQSLPLPYNHLNPDRDLSRLSADISYDDKALIKSICPKKGILNQITQLFFSSITNHLREHQITYYSPDNERYFIDLITRGCASFELVGPVTAKHVHGRTSLAHSGTPRSLLESSDSQEETHKREARNEDDEVTKGPDGQQIPEHVNSCVCGYCDGSDCY